MNKYFVRYIADTSFSLCHRTEHVKNVYGKFHISFPNIEVFCYEQLAQIGDRFLFEGMAFDSYVSAPSLKEAQALLKNIIYNILDTFVYISLSPWVNLILVASYEADDNLDSRKCYYYFYDTKKMVISKAIRPVSVDTFGKVMELLDKNEFKDHVLASFHQLNKGFQSDTDVDEFFSYWTVLEYLARPLNEKRGYLKEERFYDCPSCHNPLSICPSCKNELSKQKLSPGAFKCISEIAQEKLGISKKDFDKIISTRGNIIHGGDWDRFNEAFNYKNLVGTLCIYCIAELLGLDENNLKLVLEKQPFIRNKTTTNMGMVYGAELSGLDKLPNIDDPSSQPTVTVKNSKELVPEINDDGSINVGKNQEYLHSGPKEIKFNKISYAIYSHKMSGVKMANISEGILKKGKMV